MSKVKFGLCNVALAPRTVASSGGKITYGAPVKLPGAVKSSVARESSKNKFFADNIPYFVSNSKSGQTIDLEVADIPREILKEFLGYIEAKAGGILETNTPVTPSFALLFQVETDAKARKFCFYNCVAVESDEEYDTEEESIDPTTSKLSITVSGEQVEDLLVFKQVSEQDDENYETFFTTVTVPEKKAEI